MHAAKAVSTDSRIVAESVHEGTKRRCFAHTMQVRSLIAFSIINTYFHAGFYSLSQLPGDFVREKSESSTSKCHLQIEIADATGNGINVQFRSLIHNLARLPNIAVRIFA